MERGAHGAPSYALKLALVGCGGRGSGAAVQALNISNSVHLVALGEVDQSQLDKSLNVIRKQKPEQVDVPKERQFVGFDAYKKAIAEADVVILATPPGFRPMMFEEAVRQGKHVFMEKPVAVDAPGVRKILKAAKIAKRRTSRPLSACSVAINPLTKNSPNACTTAPSEICTPCASTGSAIHATARNGCPTKRK